MGVLNLGLLENRRIIHGFILGESSMAVEQAIIKTDCLRVSLFSFNSFIDHLVLVHFGPSFFLDSYLNFRLVLVLFSYCIYIRVIITLILPFA